MIDFLERYLTAQRFWSRRTFGEAKRTIGITTHIEKECEEIRKAPSDLEEWIDVMILAMDGYWRAGGSPQDLAWHLQVKQDKNFARQWPAPRPETEATEHLK